MRSNRIMSHSELEKSFYYSENAEYLTDGLDLMGFQENVPTITTEQMNTGADCRFHSLGNNMACHGALKRKETFGGIPYTKTNSCRQRHARRATGNRPIYRHIPHRDKPPHLVARRNARERRRVQAVNNAFCRLRRHVPYENKQKRLSKVKTLRFAIDYINKLKAMVEEYDARLGCTSQSVIEDSHPKKTRWSNERFFAIETGGRYEATDWSGYDKRLQHYNSSI